MQNRCCRLHTATRVEAASDGSSTANPATNHVQQEPPCTPPHTPSYRSQPQLLKPQQAPKPCSRLSGKPYTWHPSDNCNSIALRSSVPLALLLLLLLLTQTEASPSAPSCAQVPCKSTGRGAKPQPRVEPPFSCRRMRPGGCSWLCLPCCPCRLLP